MYRFVLFSLLFVICLSQNSQKETVLTKLNWIDDTSGYDYRGYLEFCCATSGTYGYRDASLTPSLSPCSTPGPTMRLVRGKKYLIILTNTCTGTVTNLHTHGLHISGDGNSDDITRSLPYGQCLGYNITVLPEHVGGTYWYHAHHHKFTHTQVAGGAFGVLIVEDTDDNKNYPELPNSLSSSVASQIQTWMDQTNEKIIVFGVLMTPSTPNMGLPTCNGVTNCSFNMVANQWYRLRILVLIPLVASNQITLNTPSTCETHEVAHDGIWYSSVPYQIGTKWVISSAGRLDLAISCTASSSITWNINTQYKSPYPVVNLVVASGGAATLNLGSPFGSGKSVWNPVRPSYLTDLTAANVPPNLQFSAMLNHDNVIWNNVPVTWETSMYNPAATISYGNTCQLTVVRNTTESTLHPFHLHVYPMQVVGVLVKGQLVTRNCSSAVYSGSNGRSSSFYYVGQFYDTILSSIDDCVVRFQANNYSGRVVFHCHFLHHEDQGAMTWFNVTGGPTIPTLNPPVAAQSCPLK